MKHRFTWNSNRHQWRLRFLSSCIGMGTLLIVLSEPLIAQTIPRQQIASAPGETPATVTPANQSEALNKASAPSTTGSTTDTPAPATAAPSGVRSPQSIAAVLSPTLTHPVLPPIGDANAYLPSAAEALDLHLVVKLSDRRVYVYKGEKALISYPIAIGKPGWETPVGTYKVLSMEKNPIFKSFKSGAIIHPGPDNPLGVRWIGIWTDGKTQLGFHGTNQPELIGQAVSHGCIRMYNKDVVALYEQIAPGITVKVEP